MKIIAFIPLRGGSVSIPLKNIKELNGRPLAYYAIDAVVQSEKIEKVYIATDSDEIKNVIEAYPSDKVVVVGRTPEVSTNISPTIDVMLEFSRQYEYETMVLLQATSPLVTVKDVNNAIQQIEDGYDSVVSVVRQHRFIWDEKTHRPHVYPELKDKPRRQDWEGVLIENGAIYVAKRDNLLRDNFYLTGNVGFVEMHPRTYVELDEPHDWDYVEYLLSHQK